MSRRFKATAEETVSQCSCSERFDLYCPYTQIEPEEIVKGGVYSKHEAAEPAEGTS